MALALSSPVWVEITDPESRNTFYANLVNALFAHYNFFGAL
jgi:hypothetical protein